MIGVKFDTTGEKAIFSLYKNGKKLGIVFGNIEINEDDNFIPAVALFDNSKITLKMDNVDKSIDTPEKFEENFKIKS